MAGNNELRVAEIGKIAETHAGKPGALLAVLKDVQLSSESKYLSPDDLDDISRATGIPASRVWSMATFYSYYTLAPQGVHTIVVCRGTSCHTRGSKSLLEHVIRLIRVGNEKAPSGTMPDPDSIDEIPYTDPTGFVTIRTVPCFGQCVHSPVVEIDGVRHVRVTFSKLSKLVSDLFEGARR